MCYQVGTFSYSILFIYFSLFCPFCLFCLFCRAVDPRILKERVREREAKAAAKESKVRNTYSTYFTVTPDWVSAVLLQHRQGYTMHGSIRCRYLVLVYLYTGNDDKNRTPNKNNRKQSERKLLTE